MLEALLKHFRSYGMKDLEFIIVNSKLYHSQDKLHELQRRVSFEVYQETEEEEVWDLMQGGKDDMFIYDRCGRLTYYIPFPLSILNESPLVSNAILATYFRSPCGDSCDGNKTADIDEVVKNLENDYETENITGQENSTYFMTETTIYENETTNDTQYTNELYDVVIGQNETDIMDTNNTGIVRDYDYPVYGNLNANETNSTKVEEAKSYFNSIYKLFFNSENRDNKEVEDVPLNTNFNETSIDDNNNPPESHNHNNTDISDAHMHHAHHKHKDVATEEKKKSDRCLEADYEVCKSWSKKRLLHVQRCCSELHSHPESRDRKSCHHFGKKRCKKMQSILKCCIKTEYTDQTTAAPIEEHTPSAEEDGIVTATEKGSSASELKDIVCCKSVNEAKQCRVSYSGACEEDENIEQSPSKPM